MHLPSLASQKPALSVTFTLVVVKLLHSLHVHVFMWKPFIWQEYGHQTEQTQNTRPGAVIVKIDQICNTSAEILIFHSNTKEPSARINPPF